MTDNNDLHLTKSHLLRRILQQQVERLEAEKADLQTEVARLEQGLIHSRDPEVESSSSAASELQTLVEETLTSIRAISEQAKREAAFTLKVTRHEQEKVLSEMATLLQEGERLKELLLEAMEGVHSIDEQGQSHTTLMIKEAHLQQERFIIEVRSLQHGRGSDPTLLAQKRHKMVALRERAQAEAERLKLEAHLAREKVVKEIRVLHAESQKLRGAVGRALDHAHTLSEGIYVGAAHAVQAEEPPTQAKATSRVPQTSSALPEPPPPPKRSALFGLLLTLLFALLLGLTALGSVERLPGSSKAFLFDYRYLIWIVGGAVTYWLLANLNGWEHQARTSKWLAERDYAIWWVWRARVALILLVPLLTLTTAVALR